MARKTKLELDGGIDVYANILNELSVRAIKVEKKGLYEFARVFRDAIIALINGLPTMTEQERHNAALANKKFDPTPEQKAGLVDGLYVNKHKQDGTAVVTAIGFAGYNGRKSKGYWRRDIKGRSYYVPPELQSYGFPAGEPNVAVADWVNNGTTHYKAHKFIQKALSQSKDAAAAAGGAAMVQLMDEIINKENK